MILARGAVVDALQRYDPAFRVRWSNERKEWCIDYPVRRRDLLVPPVKYEKLTDGTWKEHLLPEDSERYILFHSKREAVIYTKKLTKSVLARIWAMDGNNRDFKKAIKDGDARSQASRTKKLADKLDAGGREGFDYLKFKDRKNPNGSPQALLGKEDRIAIEADGEKKVQKLLETA